MQASGPAIPVQRSNQLSYRGQLSNSNHKFLYMVMVLGKVYRKILLGISFDVSFGHTTVGLKFTLKTLILKNNCINGLILSPIFLCTEKVK